VREYLDKEEGHTIGLEGTTQLDKAELGVQLSHALKLAVLLEDLLVDFLLLDVLGGQEISQAVMVTSVNHFMKGKGEGEQEENRNLYLRKPGLCLSGSWLPNWTWHCRAANWQASSRVQG